MTGKEQAKLVRDPFYKDYAAKWDGRKPYVDSGVVKNWKAGDEYPESAIGEAIKNLTIFSEWFSEHGLRSDSNTCSDKLIFYPGMFLTPDYMTKRAAAPSIGNVLLSTYWGGPDFTLPSKLMTIPMSV